MPLLTFDPDAMHRAILNVVTNAIDACEKVEQGRVIVRTAVRRPIERLLRIVVEDNGEGISPEDLTKIFSVFESRKGSRGTGLGLPVSQKIMHEHEGDISSKAHRGRAAGSACPCRPSRRKRLPRTRRPTRPARRSCPAVPRPRNRKRAAPVFSWMLHLRTIHRPRTRVGLAIR